MSGNQNPFFTILGGDPFGVGGDSGQGPGQQMPHVDFKSSDEYRQLKDKFSNMGKKAAIISVIVAVIVLAIAYWWFHPPINIHSTDTWAFVAVFILLPTFLIFRSRYRAYKNGTDKVSPSAGKAKTFKALSLVPVVVLALGLVGALLSTTFFPGNAEKYANVLQTQDSTFADDIQQVDYNEIPVIDRDSAVLLGNRTMGTMSDLVSQFEISPLYSQINYQNHPVRVSPLGYADLFKWLQNREQGIPAYVIVDMTTQDAQVVRLEEGKTIKYSESEPLARNIDRYVQLKYPFYMFGEKSFEIDDEGNAWWICPVRDFTIGLFGGETISRAVMVNAATGECQDVAVSDVPNWVDHVYPADLLIKQYNWSGAYSNGWINSWLGQNGVVRTTPGNDGQLGYNYIAKDDDVWVYTGVTSATGDDSIVGFVLMNQRTGESNFYSVSGATETSAMASAEGQVQQMRYTSTFPILINVNDRPTYFMALKDGAGLVKMYAMVDIESYQNVAVGDSVEETQKSYISMIGASGAASSGEGSAEGAASTTGVIATVAQAVVDGNSHFYVTLEGDSRIFDFALPGMVEIVAYGVGDTITIEFSEGDPLCAVQGFSGESATDSAEGGATGDSGDAGTSDAEAGDASTASGDAAEGESAAQGEQPASDTQEQAA